MLAQKGSIPIPGTHPIDIITCRASYSGAYTGESTEAVAAYLKKHFNSLEAEAISIRLINIIESKGGKHLLFQQCYNGIPVYRAQVKVNMDKKGRIRSVFDNSFSISTALSIDFGSNEGEKNYFFNGEELVPAVRIEMRGPGSNYYEVIHNSQGNEIYRHDLNSYHHAAQDSTVNAMIFRPDPLTSAGVVYGSPYVDSSDFDVPQLNAQRQTISMKVDYNNDTFRLKGPYGIVKEFDNPVTTPAFCKTTANFNYTRNQQEFEDANAFYYITMYHDYVASLGFNNIVNYQVWIDAHAMGGADNSMFSPGFTPARLLFGEGGVDDAEDADVILHEYGHAMSYSAAPNTNTGTQRQTLDEANSDYFAASYSRFQNTFSWGNVYSWDGHNPFWPGRVVVSSKQYPSSLVNNIYTDAEIWSSTIMEIWGDIGRQTTDEILIESMYSYASGMNMPMAAQLFIKADSTLNAGANYTAICNRFKNRGILSSCLIGIDDQQMNSGVLLVNSQGFAKGEALSIILSPGVLADISLFDCSGRIVKEMNGQSSDCLLSGQELSAGTYILHVRTNTGTLHSKLLKY